MTIVDTTGEWVWTPEGTVPGPALPPEPVDAHIAVDDATGRYFWRVRFDPLGARYIQCQDGRAFENDAGVITQLESAGLRLMPGPKANLFAVRTLAGAPAGAERLRGEGTFDLK
jgi:hypothetical protein